MRRLFIVYTFGFLLITSCESDPAPSPSPESTVDPPGKAVLSLPANNKACEQGEVSGNTSAVQFNWEPSGNTETYSLAVTNLDTQSTTNKDGLTSTSSEMSLDRGHPYSWIVTSKNSGNVTTASNTWKFYLAGDGESNFAPFPVDAIYPAAGATISPVDGKVTIRWEESEDPDGDAVTYTLFADTIDGLQAPPAAWQNITGTSVEIDVSVNTVYYWRVITSDGHNTSASNIFTFKTQS